MTLKLFTYPVDIIESTSGIQLVRGANRFIIRDERSSTIVRLIVALSSEGIILDELISEFSDVLETNFRYCVWRPSIQLRSSTR